MGRHLCIDVGVTAIAFWHIFTDCCTKDQIRALVINSLLIRHNVVRNDQGVRGECKTPALVYLLSGPIQFLITNLHTFHNRTDYTKDPHLYIVIDYSLGNVLFHIANYRDEDKPTTQSTFILANNYDDLHSIVML